jgi:hypothetical protein
MSQESSGIDKLASDIGEDAGGGVCWDCGIVGESDSRFMALAGIPILGGEELAWGNEATSQGCSCGVAFIAIKRSHVASAGMSSCPSNSSGRGTILINTQYSEG